MGYNRQLYIISTGLFMKKFTLLALVFFAVTAGAQSVKLQDTKQGRSIQIPEDLRALLRQEMGEVRKGMESLMLHIISAQWPQIETVGTQIKNSYIMKKSLTPEQMKQLHGALPRGFKKIDHKFHGYAGKLAEAARAQDMELVQYYFSKMQHSCTACHSRFAGDRFPGFSGTAGSR